MKLSETDLILHLRSLGEADVQREFLLNAGMPEEQIADYLRYVNTDPEPVRITPDVPFTASDVGKEIMERLRQRAAVAAKEPEPTVTLSPEERHLQIVRLMTGGHGFDGVRLDYPSKATKFLSNEFHRSNRRAALLLGVPGCGKTWAAVAYAASITNPVITLGRVQHVDSLLVTAPELFEMIQDKTGYYRQKLEAVRNRRILVIDDLGAEPGGYKGGDFVAYFDGLFDQRYRRRLITLMTSNATVDDRRLPDGSIIRGIKSTYGERFLSRFNDIGMYYESDDADFRRVS